jgi:hypothetical protein
VIRLILIAAALALLALGGAADAQFMPLGLGSGHSASTYATGAFLIPFGRGGIVNTTTGSGAFLIPGAPSVITSD